MQRPVVFRCPDQFNAGSSGLLWIKSEHSWLQVGVQRPHQGDRAPSDADANSIVNPLRHFWMLRHRAAHGVAAFLQFKAIRMHACSRHNRGRRPRLACLALSTLSLSACSASPSRNILGSYFPTWMICAVLGIAGVAVLRMVLIKTGIDAVLPIPVLVYLCFWVAVTLAIWLVWLA
jgi:hypothetical protein